MKTTTIKCDLCNKIIPTDDNIYEIHILNQRTKRLDLYSDVCLECYYKINTLIEKLRRPYEKQT